MRLPSVSSTILRSSYKFGAQLRAEYGARLIIEHPHEEIEPLAKECGFIGADAFNSSFKFALGVTPAEYRNSMLKLFKDEQSA